MNKSFRFIIILTGLAFNIYAQDSDKVTGYIQHNLSASVGFNNPEQYNPGTKPYTRQLSLSEINVGYEKQTGKGALLQEGTQFYDYSFRAQSYSHLNQKYHVWGEASYVNRRTDNVKWNESSDYKNIYPYVIADSVGGNNLKGEKYSFMGGYAQNIGKFSWGIRLDYWALLEYRSVNPRPNNKTSNLIFDAGINYSLTNKYALGGGIRLRKYKQRDDLSFNTTLATPYIYHMSGLGMDSYLFANNYTGCLFDGKGYGANIQITPSRGYGLLATLHYESFSFDKELNSNQNIVPSMINEDKYATHISYIEKKNKHVFGIKLSAIYTDRRGEENKFTRNVHGAFVKISSEVMYKNKINIAQLEILYQNNNVNAVWYVKPYVLYCKQNETYKSADRKMQITNLNMGIKPGISLPLKKHLLHIDANIGYSKNLDSELNLTGLLWTKSITQTLKQNYDYLSSEYYHINSSVRFDYFLTQKNMTIYSKAQIDYKKYDWVDSDFFSISLGVAF